MFGKILQSFKGRNATHRQSGDKTLGLITDWHCHILPGVDDGLQSMEEALEVLSKYEALGIAEVWLTPHIMEDIPNTTSGLRQRFAELAAAYSGSVVLRLAAENMLDNLFEERLATGDLLPIGGDGSHLLVETSYYNPPIDFDGALQRIRQKGFFPLLAHPERYVYMGRDDYKRLKAQGVKFQLNLPSLVGGYGEEVRKKAEWLLRNGYYNVAATDLHRLTVLSRLRPLENFPNEL